MGIYMWPTLLGLLMLDALSFWFIPRDFSGNDGCADDRKFQ